MKPHAAYARPIHLPMLLAVAAAAWLFFVLFAMAMYMALSFLPIRSSSVKTSREVNILISGHRTLGVESTVPDTPPATKSAALTQRLVGPTVLMVAAVALLCFTGCVPEAEVQQRVNSAVANVQQQAAQDKAAIISQMKADADRRLQQAQSAAERRVQQAQSAGLAQGELRARQQLEAKFEASVEQRVAPYKAEVTNLQGQLADLKRDMVTQVATAKETGTAIGKQSGYVDGLKDARTEAAARQALREKELAELKDAEVAKTQVEARAQGEKDARISRFWSDNAFTLAVISLVGCAVLLAVFILLNRNFQKAEMRDSYLYAEVEGLRDQLRITSEGQQQMAQAIIHLLPPAANDGGVSNAQ